MPAYYNENDPFTAAWLRELIKAKLIADGEVDERSIELVQPDDLRGFVQCHFFAGIGGWSYALRLAGWPDERAVWTGSCPCQPWSSAGKGTRADDSRDLWPTWFRLISECRPNVVFGEQVASADGRAWFDRTASDLEIEGYAIGPADLPACSVGTPHIRHRLWFVADRHAGRCGGSATWEPAPDSRPDMEASQSSWRSIVRETRPSLQSPWPIGPGAIGRIPIAVDGISDVMDGRNATGNAIVPQVAQAFIEAYLDCCEQ